ncbi:MAG: hypothetical protein HUJ22_01605 [Gracilimonas sp.]|uniref:hypothetical protein n=1 Tax=Gracilimonas sp. TaxID=1974203 RepID=UPI0019BFD74B|nr:hypothetical protein [Gracilimonas sp.]MBD3615238.1 hypothetical protein [Gracilimonas sp.]
MKKILLVLITIFLFQTGTELAAQVKKEIELSGENIEPGVQVYEYVREQNGKLSTLGTITEMIKKTGDRMVIVYRQALPNIVIEDSLVVNSENFAPKFYRSTTETRENITVKYNEANSGADIRVKRRGYGLNQDTSYSANFDQLRYDSHWLPTLLYAIEKGNAISWEIPIYSYNNKEGVLRIRKEGVEEVTLHEKMYEAVKYEVSRKNSEDIYHYWIDKGSKRLLQTRGEINPNLVVWLRIKAQT